MTSESSPLTEVDEVFRQSLTGAIQAYTTVLGLPNLLPKLVTTANSLSQSRDASVSARKNLAESTKVFKRVVKNAESNPTATTVQELAKEGRACIKGYQDEIDSLTRRCKTSETALSNVHQILGNIPDPAPILSLALENLETMSTRLSLSQTSIKSLVEENEQLKKRLEEASTKVKPTTHSVEPSSAAAALTREEREELIQLRREVAEYEVEFRGLQNQDITIRKLEAKIEEMQESNEQSLQEQLAKVQEEITEKASARVADALDREATMERRLQALEMELRAERAGRVATQTKLFESDEGLGQREAAWEAQKAIFSGEADRLRESLGEVSRERDELRLKLEMLKGQRAANSSSSSSTSTALTSKRSTSVLSPPPSEGMVLDIASQIKAYEAEISELTSSNAMLREEMRVLDGKVTEERRVAQASIMILEREKHTLLSEVAQLEAQISNSPSNEVIEKMQRELRILKRLEYNADEDLTVSDENRRDPEMTSLPANHQESDLETILVNRLRKMEADLVKERNAKVQKQEEYDMLLKRVAELERDKEEAQKLISSLESDLQLAIASPPLNVLSAGDSSVIGRSALPGQPSSNDETTLQRILFPGEAMGESSVAPVQIPLEQSKSTTEKANDDHSVVTIIMAQRDRLRARCDGLEAERDSFKQELQVQVRLAESLKTDNTKLYEKVRYLQNFNKNRPDGMAYNDADLDLEALEERYEASVDPFRQFSRAERQRKLKEMSPLDRFVFVGAKTVLATKQMRTVLFCYIVGMHLLVFFTTHQWGYDHGQCEDFLSGHEDLAHLHHGVPKLGNDMNSSV
jgi:homeobox protein cut-like